MTDINRLLNTTSAGMIAQKLDAKDGAKDGNIKASIWNDFVKEIGTGKEVKDSISIQDAMKSITKYVISKAKEVGKNVETLANEWSNKVGDSNTADEADDADKAGDASAADGKKADKSGDKKAGTKPSSQAQADYNSIKVTVPMRYSSAEVKKIINNRNKGKQLTASLRKGYTQGITKDNVAYALSANPSINFGPNSQRQAITVFEKLVDKMHDLGIFRSGKEYGRSDSFAELPPKKQNEIIHNYTNRIIAAEKQIINNDDKEKKYHNANLSKIQKTFDGANKLLADVANMKQKPKIESGNNNGTKWKSATLSNGQRIKVIYDQNGDISEIMISHDKTPDHDEDGSTFNGAEVSYTKTEAWYNIDHSNNDYEGSITSGYNFEKLKALAKKIFG